MAYDQYTMLSIIGLSILVILVIVLIVRKRKVSSDLSFIKGEFIPEEDDETENDLGEGLYSARRHFTKAAILKEEGQIDQAVAEIKKVREIQATRDMVYFKSFKQLIEDNIREKKYELASKFLEKYEEMLGVSSERQYTLVSYSPFQEFFHMKMDVAIGLRNGQDALKYSLMKDWFRFHEKYETPVNVLKFAYEEFITYLKELNGEITSRKYLPKIKNYLSWREPSIIDPLQFLDIKEIKTINRKFKIGYPIESVEEFVKKTFYLDLEEFIKVLETYLSGEMEPAFLNNLVKSQGTIQDQIQDAISYALMEITRVNVYFSKGDVVNNVPLFKYGDDKLLNGIDICEEFYKEREFTSLQMKNKILPTIYFLLYWDIIHERVNTENKIDTNDHDEHSQKNDELPPDFYREGFVERRHELFSARESELYELDLLDECKEAAARISGKKSPVFGELNNQTIDWNALEKMFASCNKMKLISLIQLMANDFRLFKGLPHLFLYPNQGGQGKFVVVKPDMHRFSEIQLFWILNIHYNLQIPIEIFYIREPHQE